MKYSTSKGFTLMELMIVVAIVGILSAIAYPAYTDSVLKGRRAQGRTALAELLQQQERYLTQTNCYQAFSTNSSGVSTAVSSCGLTPSPVPFKNFAGENLASASYLLSATTCSTGAISDCVQVQAVPIKSDPAAGTLTMTVTGVKSCTGTASSSNPKLCWP